VTVVCLPGPDWVEDVGPVGGLGFVTGDLRSVPERAGEVAVVVPPYIGGFDLGVLAKLPRLELVQLLTAGYDGLVEAVPPGVALANAAGVHETSTAELAVTLILAALRGIPEFVVAQRASRWLPSSFWSALADRRVLILGYGAIGRAIAARLTPFEVELTAVASRARAGDHLVRSVHGVDEVLRLLPEHDVVVVTVPLTEATAGLVDEVFLGAMPDGALLVNVARGKVADTEALLRHAGRLRLALDVTDPEPLPRAHPLWSAPGVLISPHTGGASTAFRPRAVRLLREQLGAFSAGRPLRNVVHRG
jgi:phosphoglycerate dehydrogenase-like enzyme